MTFGVRPAFWEALTALSKYAIYPTRGLVSDWSSAVLVSPGMWVVVGAVVKRQAREPLAVVGREGTLAAAAAGAITARRAAVVASQTRSAYVAATDVAGAA